MAPKIDPNEAVKLNQSAIPSPDRPIAIPTQNTTDPTLGASTPTANK